MIETLRSQHAALLEALVPLSQVEAPPGTGGHRMPTTLSPHAEIHEEPIAYSPVVGARRHSFNTMRSSTKRASVSSGSIWFDASEGAEEFLIDSEDEDMAPVVDDDAESVASVEKALAVADEEPSKASPSEEVANEQHVEESPAPPQVVRRSRLPAPASTEEVSLFAVLRKNVGKVSSYPFVSVSC